MRLKDYRLNEASRSYERGMEFWGKPVTIRVVFDPEESGYQTLEECISQVEKRLEWLRSNNDLVEQELVKLYPGWLDDEDDWEENPITEAEFVGRMALTGINFLEDLSFYLCYDDGDVFWGHGILVSFTSDCHFTDAAIAG